MVKFCQDTNIRGFFRRNDFKNVTAKRKERGKERVGLRHQGGKRGTHEEEVGGGKPMLSEGVRSEKARGTSNLHSH